MINRVVLVGRITKDIQMNATKSGIAIAGFNLAVERPFKDKKTGERQADFIRCIAWRKTAELLNQYCHKGSRIGVDGRIQTRSYKNRDGNDVYVTEVVCENISFLESKNSNSKGNNGGSYSSGNSYSTSDSNQNSKPKAEDPFAQEGDINITDDDLPF